MNLLQKATAGLEREREADKDFVWRSKPKSHYGQVAICLFAGLCILAAINGTMHPEKAAARAAVEQSPIALAKEAEKAKLEAMRAEHSRRFGLDQPAEYIMEHCQTEASREADRAVMRTQILRDEYSRRFGQ